MHVHPNEKLWIPIRRKSKLQGKRWKETFRPIPFYSFKIFEPSEYMIEKIKFKKVL